MDNMTILPNLIMNSNNYLILGIKYLFYSRILTEGVPLAEGGEGCEREGGSSAFAFEPRTFPLGRP